MSSYLIVYLGLVCFAISLAAADISRHTEGGKKNVPRKLAVEGEGRVGTSPVDSDQVEPLLQVLRETENRLGLTPNKTGEIDSKGRQ